MRPIYSYCECMTTHTSHGPFFLASSKITLGGGRKACARPAPCPGSASTTSGTSNTVYTWGWMVAWVKAQLGLDALT